MQIIDKIRTDLAYRLPSGVPLGSIILSREQAEKLVDEWDELTQERPRMQSERAVLAIVYVAIIAAIAIILFISFSRARAGELLECSSQKNGNGYWSWREIDGRRCWYPGAPGKSKTELHWRRSLPQKPSSVVGQPGINVPIPELLPREEVVQDGRGRTSDKAMPASSEARALSSEDEELLTTYWPDLAELEATAIGLKPLPPLEFEPLRISAPPQHSSSWSWLWVFLVPAGYVSFVFARRRMRS